MDRLMDISLVTDQAVWAFRIALLVAFVWVVVRWPKASSPTVSSVARRVGSLAVVSLLTVVTLAAPINAQYGWYPSVGDFFPGASEGATLRSAESSRAAVLSERESSPLVTGTRARPDLKLSLTPTASGSGAGYQDFTVEGPRSGVTGTVTVWFPREYLSRPDESFPVIEGFHGIKPAPYAFFNAVDMDRTISGLVDRKKMRPALLVIPHWAPDGVDNECVDSAGGKMETWLTKDIPAWTYSTFLVLPGRESFAAWGMSAGGWCASMSAMLHPDTFATAVSLGGCWRPDFDPGFVPFRKGGAEWQRYDLIALAHRRPPAVAMWNLYGRSDELAAPSTQEMMRAVTPPTSLTSIELPHGGHNTDVWLPHVGQTLQWLAQTSPSFRPS